MSKETKSRLQDATDYKVMTFWEAVKALNWNLDENAEGFLCTCDCGKSKIEYSGFFGIEVVECESCGKKAVNMFSPMQTGPSTASILDYRQFELEKDENGYDRFWVADDGKGGIKNV